jgi:predicted signal transduction protein with EAL and GGDEF domain
MVFELSALITVTHTQIGLATDLVALPWIAVYAACFATARSFFTVATVMTVGVIIATALSSVLHPWFTTIRILVVAWCASIALQLLIRALRRRAETDGLTEILNRTGFFRMALAAGVQRDNQTTYVALLDLDGFKTINDQHGHLVSLIGSLLRNDRTQIFLHRSEDLVGALGPDERLRVLVPGLGPLGNPSGEFGHTVVDTVL